MIPWLIISIAVLLVLGVVLAVLAYKSKGKKHEPDYYTFFVMGIICLPLGIALDNYGIFGLGAVFMIVGLAHKDKWKRNHTKWKDMSPEEKNVKLAIMAILGVLVLLTLLLYLLR